MPTPLPIDAELPAIASALERGNLVLVAEPGAGKTTRVPPALLAGRAGGVVVLEPRRLAARMAAARVAGELGDEVGGVVGYEVRFERRRSARTRLAFVTEGLLARRLGADPTLAGVDVVVIDEFHERHLVGDLALALVRRLQRERRPELRIAVMSATIDAEPVAAFLDAPIVRVAGRVHPVAIEYLPQPAEALDREVPRAIRRLLDGGLEGDVLVFLPGAAEIARCQGALAELAARHDLLVLPLHGSLPAAAQDRAVAPAARRKVVLSTNVAETSLTIDGVVAVVDGGLARVPRHSPWSGVATLEVEPVSKASLVQRAGRAGRTRAGRCLRLMTRHEFDGRREHDSPEIQRSDLADAALALHAGGVAHLAGFPWFEPPPAAALEAADSLLARLGAIDPSGALTAIGRRLSRFPVHPRHARLLVDAEERGVGREACVVAALLGERDVRSGRRGRATATSDSDLMDDVDAFVAARHGGLRTATLRDLGLEPGAAFAVDRAATQLERLVDRGGPAPTDRAGLERALGRAILAGHPDRVARRRRPGEPELVLADGGGATLAPSSAVLGHELMIALDAEERGRGRERKVTVRSAHAVELDDLLEVFLDRIVETDEVVFDPVRERVERLRRMSYDALVLDESRDVRGLDDAAAAAALVAAARARGAAAFVDRAALDHLRARLAAVAAHGAGPELATLDDAELDRALAVACDGARSFADVRAHDLLALVWAARGAGARAALDRLAPEAIALPGRKRVPVHYEAGKAPWIESRLQDFIGLADGPRICNGAVPLTLHLLAPNGRAVQVTADLASFWRVHYPELRRQLMRRYPKHRWP